MKNFAIGFTIINFNILAIIGMVVGLAELQEKKEHIKYLKYVNSMEVFNG